jgi:hypothetical protein
MTKNKTTQDMYKILKYMKENNLILDHMMSDGITLKQRIDIILRRNKKIEPKNGYVTIVGSEIEFNKIVKEEHLEKEARQIYKDHPGEKGYYTFLKYLWIQYPDDRDAQRLNEIIPL